MIKKSLVLSILLLNASAFAADVQCADQGTQKFLNVLNSGGGKPMEQMTPQDARAVLTGAQNGPGVKLPNASVSKKEITVDGNKIDLTIVRPSGIKGTLPVFMFFHGGGWVLGDFKTHERLVRDLVSQSGAVAVFVNYTPSPEAHYPVAINQAYEATKWVAEHGKEIQIDSSKLAVVGNSVGGNMATVVALKAKLENGPKIKFQLLLWPVTDANFETASYGQFAEKHFLSKNMMKWFWDNYTTDSAKRKEIYASPLNATKEQLTGMPTAFVLVAECDVLRDEGEAYARKLDSAGVSVTLVRYDGMIHDFGLLNPLRGVPGVESAMVQAGKEIREHLK